MGACGKLLPMNYPTNQTLEEMVIQAERYELCRPELYLASVMTHLANKVMDAGDVQAWHICYDLQLSFWQEQMGGHEC
jgi:hypothetical protein